MRYDPVEWLAYALVDVYVRRPDPDPGREKGRPPNVRSRAHAVARHISWYVEDAARAGVPRDVLDRRLGEWRTQFGYKISSRDTLEDALDAVQESLRDPPRRRPLLAIVTFALDYWFVVAPVLGLLATIALGASYKAFYDRLGLSTEDVGMEPAAFVAGSVGGALLLFIIVALVFFGAVAPIVAVLPGLGARADRNKRFRLVPVIEGSRQWRILTGCVLATFGATTFLALSSGASGGQAALLGLIFAAGELVIALAAGLRTGWLRALMAAIVGVMFAAIVADSITTPWIALGLIAGPVDLVGSRVRARRAEANDRPAIEVPALFVDDRESRAIAGALTLIAFVFVCVALPLLASDKASELREGNEVASVDVFGVPLLGVEARAVTPRWTSPNAASTDTSVNVSPAGVNSVERGALVPQIPGCVLDLGRDSSGAVVLYQVRRAESLITPGKPLPVVVQRRALRVSQDAVVLIGGNRHCDLDDSAD